MLEKGKLLLSILLSIPNCIRHFQAYPPIFIIGSPRSGTTLTLKLFENQPQITTSLEPFKLWKKAFRSSVDDTYQSSINVLGLQVLRYFYYQQIIPTQPYLVVKDPRDSIRVNTIKRLFPNAKFIHVLRDGRDVIASIMKTSQNDLYLTEDDQWPHVRIPGYRKLFENPCHINAAIQWKYCVETSLNHLAEVEPSNVLTFYYEELVANPEVTANKILSFCCPEINQQELEKVISTISDQVVKTENLSVIKSNQSWKERMEQYSSLVADDAGSGTTAEQSRVSRWKNELDAQTLSECYPIIEDTLKKLNFFLPPS
jgi:hypothetical protein